MATHQPTLNATESRRFRVARIVIAIVFLSIASVLLYKILFPNKIFVFNFRTPNSLSNSITEPRSSDRTFNDTGRVEKELFFDAATTGQFSSASVLIQLEKDSDRPSAAPVSVSKGYRALFYPLSDTEIFFKNGSLLEWNGTYYFVSRGLARPFSSEAAMERLGFDTATARHVDIGFSSDTIGERITDSSTYPLDTTFVVDDSYYQLTGENTLTQYISTKAYTTHFSNNTAIPATKEFLDLYEIEESFIPFADGTLLSAGVSVFLTSGNQLFPINNTTTFESMGFVWDDVLDATSEEVGIYERQPLFRIDSPHPNGTIFYDQDTETYFMVQDASLHPIVPDAAFSYLQHSPISFDSESLSAAEPLTCSLKRHLLPFSKKYSCTLDITSVQNQSGNAYQFMMKPDTPIDIHTIDVTLHQETSPESARDALSDIKKRIILRYLGEEALLEL